MNLTTILKVLDGIVIIIGASKTILDGFDNKNSNDSNKDRPQY